MWNSIVSAVSNFVNTVRNNVTNVLNTIGNIGSDILGKVASFPSLLISAGGDLINGLIAGINAAKGAVVSTIQNIAAGALDAIKSFFGIKSPSRVMRDQVGKQIGAGLAEGLMASTNRVKKATESLSKAAMMDVPDIQLPSIKGGMSTGGSVVPSSIPSGLRPDAQRNLSNPAGTGTAMPPVNFNVYPSEGLNEVQIAESAMEHMYWKLQTSSRP